jgi:hypothetical protein
MRCPPVPGLLTPPVTLPYTCKSCMVALPLQPCVVGRAGVLPHAATLKSCHMPAIGGAVPCLGHQLHAVSLQTRLAVLVLGKECRFKDL